jgi:hypothetical protein
LCFVTAKCKAKGPFACAWQPPPPVVAVLTSAEQAAALGYPTRYNSHTDAFPSKHKTSSVPRSLRVSGFVAQNRRPKLTSAKTSAPSITPTDNV